MTPRHQMFADAKLRGASDTDAAITAGYSRRSAYNQGNRLMRNDEIKAYIDERKRKAAESVQVDREWVLREMVDTYHAAREEKQLATARAALRDLGEEVAQMWPKKITITREDQEAARIAAEQMGVSYEEVIAEVERELREARAT